MNRVDKIASWLIIAGALNWGLIGLFDFDVIEYVFGEIWIDKFLYILIGISSVYKIVNCRKGKGH